MKRITKAQAMELSGMSEEVADCYILFWHHEHHGVCGLHRLMYHWTVHMGMDAVGHNERYCYATAYLGQMAFDEWDGEGDPPYWHKHPDTGRYQDSFDFHGVTIHIENGTVARVSVTPTDDGDGK